MKNEQTHAGRRAFLRGSMQRIVAAPLAAAVVDPGAQAAASATDADEVLPGDPGYRDPETYGNLASYDGGDDAA